MATRTTATHRNAVEVVDSKNARPARTDSKAITPESQDVAATSLGESRPRDPADDRRQADDRSGQSGDASAITHRLLGEEGYKEGRTIPEAGERP